MQNEIRGVLGWMTTGAARKNLDSREIKSLIEGCVRCIEDEREYTERYEEAQVSQRKPRELVCRKI